MKIFNVLRMEFQLSALFLFENVNSYGNILGIKIVEDIAAVILNAFAYYVVASRSRCFALRNLKCEMNFTFRKM